MQPLANSTIILFREKRYEIVNNVYRVYFDDKNIAHPKILYDLREVNDEIDNSMIPYDIKEVDIEKEGYTILKKPEK